MLRVKFNPSFVGDNKIEVLFKISFLDKYIGRVNFKLSGIYIYIYTYIYICIYVRMYIKGFTVILHVNNSFNEI